jgi:hypothetical protein
VSTDPAPAAPNICAPDCLVCDLASSPEPVMEPPAVTVGAWHRAQGRREGDERAQRGSRLYRDGLRPSENRISRAHRLAWIAALGVWATAGSLAVLAWERWR